jgi:hypothetical protein
MRMKVYILCEEVDIIGVYKTRQEALKVATDNELFNFYIEEKELKI